MPTRFAIPAPLLSKGYCVLLLRRAHIHYSQPCRAVQQREKDEAARVARQRPALRVCAELALVGVIRDAPTRSGGEWLMKALRDLVR